MNQFGQFLHASMWLRSNAEQLPSVDPTAAEIVVTAHRIADIVLSAEDKEELRQAIDEAYGHFEFARYYEARRGDPELFAIARDPERPIEFRELLLVTFFGHIARLVLLVAARDGRQIPSWLTEELKAHAEAGERAFEKWSSLTEEQIAEFNQRHQHRITEFEGIVQKAVKSGSDAYFPFGAIDD